MGPDATALPTEVLRSDTTPPPISGGTLALADDDRLAVASDPDRDRVHVVDLPRGVALHTIELPEGDEPGRVVVDSDGRAHVVARRGGVIIDIDPSSGELEGRRAVCPNPRGIAYDPELDALHVACAGGELVSLDAAGGDPWRRVMVTPDLRDVLYTPRGLAVTRLRSAEVLRLDEDGAILGSERLPVLERIFSRLDGSIIADDIHPNSAWRTITTPDGDWLMLHQYSTERAVDLDPDAEDGLIGPESGGGSDDGGGGGGGDGGGAYGGEGPNPCGGVVHPVLSIGEDAYSTKKSPLLAATVLPVDVAISPNGNRIVMAVAGHRVNSTTENGVAWIPTDELTSSLEPGCRIPHELPVPNGQYTAVAIDWRGFIVAQSRSPAQLVRIDPDDPRNPQVVALEGPKRRDTGHDLFHLDAGGGIACATCHPEGGDDGQVWRFVGVGKRHTPSLTVGLAGTAPFHWEGDLADMRALVDDVHMGRMGGEPLSDQWVEALESYLYALPIPQPLRRRGESAVTRGEALFSAWGCGSCHAGEALASNESVSLGFEVRLQVPGLRGVALHPPFMHDGRAPTLEDAVRDMLARTRPDQAEPSVEQVADVVAYLESL